MGAGGAGRGHRDQCNGCCFFAGGHGATALRSMGILQVHKSPSQSLDHLRRQLVALIVSAEALWPPPLPFPLLKVSYVGLCPHHPSPHTEGVYRRWPGTSRPWHQASQLMSSETNQQECKVPLPLNICFKFSV